MEIGGYFRLFITLKWGGCGLVVAELENIIKTIPIRSFAKNVCDQIVVDQVRDNYFLGGFNFQIITCTGESGKQALSAGPP